MAWNLVKFNKLYYRVNGGTEYEWSENSNLLLPPLLGDAQNELNAYGAQRHDYTYRAYRNTQLEVFTTLAGYNGGRGIDFNYYYRQMSNGQRIEIYRESGNNNIALVLEKNSGAAGFRIGTKYYGNYNYYANCEFPITSVDSSGNTNPLVINVTSSNIGIITDGTKYNLFCADLYGREYDVYNDENGYVLRCAGLSDQVSVMISMLLFGNVPIVSGDPYGNIGTPAEDQVQTGDAAGNGDESSDVISIPSTPTLNLAACQMINVYVPSLSDVQTLAGYLWTNFDLHDVNNSLSKVFTDPINAILSLHILPFTPSSSTAITVTFGGYATSVQIPPASEQFHDVDCGSISFSEFWGNYLDYNPYTRITACLPFVGQVDLDPDEVMGKTVKIKYRVDVVTGAFVCFLYIDGEKVLGQYAGNMAQQVPVSAADFSRLNAAILNVASTAAAGFGGAVMGGFSAASAAEGAVSAGLGLGQSAVDNVLNAKVRVAHSGGLSGSPGIMGILKPYVIIHRARQSVPADANHFKGYPCNAKFKLADLEGCGFTSVRRIKLDGIKLTEGELEELRGILAAGVYL